jgi:hypothetical protein
MTSTTPARICRRCGAATVDFPPVEVSVTAGTGWSAHSRRLVLCDDCGRLLDAWLMEPHQAHQDGPGGALASTAVASMPLQSY